ncbi:DAK2 domain-containing protein [Candidatus Poriferisodalis sp.]|uniref:DAK2 domain-containing protein n=1 Tax=Candidatus Poriferisodalis sp. TaxID=3101277 RepID=UPI003D0D771F
MSEEVSAERLPKHALDTGHVVAAVRAYGEALQRHRTTIDRLNVYPVPDGDTGTNMALTLASVASELEPVADAGRSEVCRAISHGALMGARGNSGVIVSQLLRGLAATLAPDIPDDGSGDDGSGLAEPMIDAWRLAEGLMAASTAADSAVMRPVEGTILSVARACAHAARAAVANDSSQGGAAQLVAMLETARYAGQVALERTPQQLPVLASAGVVDAGAAGYLLLLDALLNVVDGRPLPERVELPADVAAVIAHGNAGTSLPDAGVDPLAQRRDELHSHLGDEAHDPSGTRYEVMFLLAAHDERIDAFKAAWDAMGDSIVMVGGDGLWNCHIHTDDIGIVIEAGIDAGRPHRIQITDLHEQVAGLGGHAEHSAPVAGAAAPSGPDTPDRPVVGCAVVVVSPSPGLDELFASMGAQELVTGGQTMNPSTAELLAAVEAAPSQQVVVLPNNSNIVPVAHQVGAHTDKEVAVVPTKSVPAGLASLIGYDPDADAGLNAVAMSDGAEAVTAGEVTRAVRDTEGPEGHISAGEWIGLDAEGIVAAGDTAVSAATGLLDRLLRPSHEILTVIEGADAQTADTDAVLCWLTAQWPDVEIERHVGGQDHYPYLFGIE